MSRAHQPESTPVSLVLALQASDQADWIRDAFIQDPRINVLAHVADADAAVVALTEHRPSGLVTDLALPPAGCVVAMPQLLAAASGLCVLVLVSGDYEERWMDALRAGAAGLSQLPESADDAGGVIDNVIAMVAGDTVLVSPVARLLVRNLRENGSRGLRPIDSILTNREWQVLDLIEDGLTTAEIAERMVLTQDTIYTHVTHILRKLGVNTRGDAVIVASRLRQDR
jgi:DNA-binding NarL/FixJ family response regulator